MSFLKPENRIFVAGHRGLVGSAVFRKLQASGFKNLIVRTRQELDLIHQSDVDQFFAREKIDAVFMCAAKVGGIHANSMYPADFLYENMAIAANTIHLAAKHDVRKLLFLGSSCIYPKSPPQPIREEYLLSSPLESTNEAYAIAKIAGLKLCEMYQRQYGKRFISANPTNLYGPGDNFHPENSHVIPGMMRRFHEAKEQRASEVAIWGSGTPRREFLHVDDLADALVVLMNQYDDSRPINVGTGEDQTVLELAQLMREVVGFEGKIVLDPSKPDGTPRKLLDVSRIRALGWKHQQSLREGLQTTYQWALENDAFGKR